MVFARYGTEIVRLDIADVVARKRLAADGFPIVASGIPDAPAAVFMDDRVHRANGAATGRAIEDRRFLHAPKMIATIGGNRQAGKRQELGLGRR